MKRFVSICIIVLLISSCLLVNGLSLTIKEKNNGNNDDFDTFIKQIMDSSHFPSISACIIKNDDVVWSNGYGFSDIEENNLASDETVYVIG